MFIGHKSFIRLQSFVKNRLQIKQYPIVSGFGLHIQRHLEYFENKLHNYLS